ncbi:CHAT domain-containing protein [Siccirubricoccus sp. KC 17139]|uniref:CHAT domain-containing protein n=1 Tax=Siccirubricoccus soli TaxID=2899147 RepID=A0ABT1DA19_9PROT|nr:CHAT domain-containing protein [Siccirubricoccus soli]MCO6418714.1 CHAT domain-containing protein [Siccirubricoccus soli]MCP2684849.1 CHAT domain-containing protein [Siccirubricoccus soli]
MSPRRLPPALRLLPALGLLLAACSTPPEDSFVAPAQRAAAGEPAGVDAKGEACLAQRGNPLPADLPVAGVQEVFCGGWTSAAARVATLRGSTDAATLDQLAGGGLWRTWLDQRVTCAAPQATTIAGGYAARLLACTRKAGGWPHVAMVAAGPHGPVLADGVATSTPVMERLAAGQVTAAGAAQPRSAALELAVRRMAAESFSANDVSRFETLMAAGRDLNQLENFAAAEDAYRAALALQERVLGREDPNIVLPLLHLALNLAAQNRLDEAEVLFTRAEGLAPRAADETAVPRLAHYRGLAAQRAHKLEEAATHLREAEAGYAALLPSSMLGTSDSEVNLLADPTATTAAFGLAEVRRNLSRVLATTGHPAEAEAKIAESRRLLRQVGNAPGPMIARTLRTEGRNAASLGRNEAAARQLEAAARRFAVAAPGERPEAVTLFLSGGRRQATGRRSEALSAFRAGADILRARQLALPATMVLPYLDALEAEAAARPDQAEALRREMFAAAQLAQRSNTVRFVQQASARIGASGGDQRVSEAVRRLQDADQALRDLFAERDAAPSAAIDARIAEAQQARAEAESEVAAAAPGYRQLLLATADFNAVNAVLAPQEALVTMLLGRHSAWVLALRDGKVYSARASLGEAEAAGLVNAIRAGVIDQNGAPGRFDPAPAQALYNALLKPLEAALDGAETLVVVPDGPLLGIPFGLLLTGPVTDPNLGKAPFLIKRHGIVHVPSPQTLVTLRGTGAASSAPLAYGGFGDFSPPTPAQLLRSFPVDRCAADARLAQGLTRLPGTRREVLEVQHLLGAGPRDIRLGTEFTAAALRQADLGSRRILHLATHALLPGELSCLPEPSIVVSPPPGAPDANAAFVKASDLLGLKLNADLIILSACNTGGPSGAGGGEALSGLARAFFYAGARGLMVTHWAVNDDAAMLIVSDSMRRQQGGASSAAALRGAQRLILDEAGLRLPAEFGHPYYWAPFALIGDGKRAPQVNAAAAAAPRG